MDYNKIMFANDKDYICCICGSADMFNKMHIIVFRDGYKFALICNKCYGQMAKHALKYAQHNLSKKFKSISQLKLFKKMIDRKND